MSKVVELNIITLKEITDLIEVEHNKAMKVVEKLSQEPSFGRVEKIATHQNMPNGGTKPLQTYKLNKKQAIAVGAKLNNGLLMKVIDRLEELERQQQQKPLTVLEQISLIAQGTQQITDRIEILEKTKRLEGWQEKALHDTKNKKAYEFIKAFDIPADDRLKTRAIHSKIWKLFKNRYHLPRFNELPAVKFEEGRSFIQSLTLVDMV